MGLDLDAAPARSQQDDLPGAAIDRQGDIGFRGGIDRGLHEEASDGKTGRARLRRDQPRAQHIGGNAEGFFGVRGPPDAAGPASSAREDLGFDDDGPADSGGDGGGFRGRRGDGAVGDGDAARGQHGFGLVLLKLHGEGPAPILQ